MSHDNQYAGIGEGTIIMHHVLVNAGATIGKGCIINTKSLIEHEATIGDFCHISTASVINGQANIGDCCFIGSNTIIANNTKYYWKYDHRGGFTGFKKYWNCGYIYWSSFTKNTIILMELQLIQNKIFEIRGHKIMLDFDLAELYEMETKYLKRAVRANIKRFPPDFMFELSKAELEILRCNFSTSNSRGGTRYLPFAFTEQGVAMLSAVLNSDKAIDINIAIMRAFVMIRQYALTYKELADKLKEIEGKFTDVYEAINYLLNKDKLQIEQTQRKRIGFNPENSKK